MEKSIMHNTRISKWTSAFLINVNVNKKILKKFITNQKIIRNNNNALEFTTCFTGFKL